eukprot:m.348018 g.348018  ORF g.348018 m.348018 type:complete len:154 (+) comp27934_c1_seq13:922-1383(+)
MLQLHKGATGLLAPPQRANFLMATRRRVRPCCASASSQAKGIWTPHAMPFDPTSALFPRLTTALITIKVSKTHQCRTESALTMRSLLSDQHPSPRRFLTTMCTHRLAWPTTAQQQPQRDPSDPVSPSPPTARWGDCTADAQCLPHVVTAIAVG